MKFEIYFKQMKINMHKKKLHKKKSSSRKKSIKSLKKYHAKYGGYQSNLNFKLLENIYSDKKKCMFGRITMYDSNIEKQNEYYCVYRKILGVERITMKTFESSIKSDVIKSGSMKKMSLLSLLYRILTGKQFYHNGKIIKRDFLTDMLIKCYKRFTSMKILIGYLMEIYSIGKELEFESNNDFQKFYNSKLRHIRNNISDILTRIIKDKWMVFQNKPSCYRTLGRFSEILKKTKMVKVGKFIQLKMLENNTKEHSIDRSKEKYKQQRINENCKSICKNALQSIFRSEYMKPSESRRYIQRVQSDKDIKRKNWLVKPDKDFIDGASIIKDSIKRFSELKNEMLNLKLVNIDHLFSIDDVTKNDYSSFLNALHRRIFNCLHNISLDDLIDDTNSKILDLYNKYITMIKRKLKFIVKNNQDNAKHRITILSYYMKCAEISMEQKNILMCETFCEVISSTKIENDYINKTIRDIHSKSRTFIACCKKLSNVNDCIEKYKNGVQYTISINHIVKSLRCYNREEMIDIILSKKMMINFEKCLSLLDRIDFYSSYLSIVNKKFFF